MGVPSEVRRQRILAVVRSRGTARVSDLAAELEVSIVTVRRDVQELARTGQLRRGHGVAQSLVPVEQPAAPKTGDGPVALVIPERHPYLSEAMHGARTKFEEAGMRVVLHITPHIAGAERPIVERALAEGVRGLLIAPRWRTLKTEQADYGWLTGIGKGVPMVLMERRPRPGSALHAMDSVCSDHWYGMRIAVEHLAGLGHRRVVLAARDDSPTARVLRAAFAEIAAELLEDWTVVLSSPGAGPEGQEEAVELAALLQTREATAAVLHGDVDALMLMQQLADSGIRVPQDCSVVAYDDVVASLGSTPLTAVAPPKVEVGRVAAELLLARIAGAADTVERVELLPELKVRGSTQSASALSV